MHTLDALIPETTKQIIEPVSDQIARRLLAVLGISQLFSSSLFITSDDIKASNFNDENHNARMKENRCEVVVTPNYNPISSIWESFRSKDMDIQINSPRWTFGEYPIFSDPHPGIYIFEVGIPCSIEMAFTLRVKSIELADIISNAILSKSLVNAAIYDYNDISFSYPIPDRFIIMLYKMYMMQDPVVAKMKFPDYLKIGSGGAITTMVNRDRLESGSKEIVIQRSNIRVLGKLDYAGEKPDPEEINKVAERYTINFTYSYQFGRPALVRITYPIMIDNKLIEQNLIRKPRSMNSGPTKAFFRDMAINEYFIGKNNCRVDFDRSYPLTQYPDYDDWRYSSVMYGDFYSMYHAVFIGLLVLTVNPDGSLSLSVDLLNEILSLLSKELVDALLWFLNLNSDCNIFGKTGVFNITVFANDMIVDQSRVHLSDDLKLTVDGPFDISRKYRILISQIKDMSKLQCCGDVHGMIEYPTYFEDTIAANIQYLVHNKFVETIPGQFLPDQDTMISKGNCRSGRFFTGNNMHLGKYVIIPKR